LRRFFPSDFYFLSSLNSCLQSCSSIFNLVLIQEKVPLNSTPIQSLPLLPSTRQPKRPRLPPQLSCFELSIGALSSYILLRIFLLPLPFRKNMLLCSFWSRVGFEVLAEVLWWDSSSAVWRWYLVISEISLIGPSYRFVLFYGLVSPLSPSTPSAHSFRLSKSLHSL